MDCDDCYGTCDGNQSEATVKTTMKKLAKSIILRYTN